MINVWVENVSRGKNVSQGISSQLVRMFFFLNIVSPLVFNCSLSCTIPYISVAVGCSLSSTGFAFNFSPAACADAGRDSGMDNGPSQTNPQTSKILELRDR